MISDARRTRLSDKALRMRHALIVLIANGEIRRKGATIELARLLGVTANQAYYAKSEMLRLARFDR